MNEPEWLDIDIVLDFHAEQLALFGGADGIRDRGLLESALARPINKFGYGETGLAALAAAYGFGIARNHPFIDGNKRTALASMIVFLWTQWARSRCAAGGGNGDDPSSGRRRNWRRRVGALDRRSHQTARCAWHCALACLSPGHHASSHAHRPRKNRFSARAKRYANVGSKVGGVAARMAGARLLGAHGTAPPMPWRWPPRSAA